MTLDEAIKDREEAAEIAEKLEFRLCAEEHRQLAEWLKELKGYKDKNEPRLVVYSGDGYANGYMVYDMAECPNCGYESEYGDDNWDEPYCCRCGQRLKWEEEE